MAGDTIFLPFITRLKPDDATSIISNNDSTFFLFTKSKAPNGMVVKTTLAAPRKWEVVVPEIEGAQLLRVWNANNLLVTLHQSFAEQTLSFFDTEGNLKHTIPIPIGSSLRKFSGDPVKSEAIFSIKSYVVPATVYTIDLNTFYTEPFGRTLLKFDATEYMMRLTACTASDGTKIPITMVYHRDNKLDKPSMCLLKAYGGFGVMHSTDFDPTMITFLKEGGVWAYAHIRGGGEGGEEWADAGRGLNKERSFDDFINAAEFLIKEGITTSNNLAITGGSNGGLVVAAAMIKRPDLFKAVVPVVGAFDMLRFHLFTVGVFHADEYGDISTPEGFALLKRYSPYHTIKPGTVYPATLIMTSEFDDRVPPFHSYKFAAALQEANGGPNPILLRVQEDAGHSGGQTFFDRTKEESDKLDFIIHHCKTK
jgi:prolyl oligopeptidase